MATSTSIILCPLYYYASIVTVRIRLLCYYIILTLPIADVV